MDSYNRRQEIVNGLTSAIGIIFGIIGAPILIGLAVMHNNIPGIIGASIYGFCFLLLFTSSTVFHFTQELELKRVFKIIDHISIYFLIAGTYTPLVLVYLPNSFGITILSILWGLTVLGIFFKIRFTGKFEIVSVIIYLLMGFIMITGGQRFFANMPAPVIVFIWIGGGLYSVGVFFYIWDKHLYTHAVWHLLVFGGAISHYVAVLLAM